MAVSDQQQFQAWLRDALVDVLEIDKTIITQEKENFAPWGGSEEDSLIAAQESTISHVFYEETAPRCFISHALWKLQDIMEKRSKGPFEEKIRHYENNQQLKDGLELLEKAISNSTSEINVNEVSNTLKNIIQSVEPGSFPHRLFKQTKRQVDDHQQHILTMKKNLIQ